MTSEWGEDGKCVGSEMWDCAEWELWGWEQGKTRFRTRDAPTRGTVTCSRHGTMLLDTVSGHDKSSRAGGADGAMAQGHGTSLPGTAWTWHCDISVHMGIIVKFSEALPCVKSPV